MEAGRVAASARVLARAALDIVLPPSCLACRGDVAEAGRLCAACWREARFIDGPICAVCGAPFPHPVPEGALCGDCLRERPPYACARSAGLYEGPLRGLVLGLKHGDRCDAAPFLAGLMSRAGARLLSEADALVPVPLHGIRRIARRFNQAALLAQALGAMSGLPVVALALRRARHTPPQVGLGRQARTRNVAGAFRVRPAARSAVEGARLLLIDDVLTTGATVGACTRALKAAGAREVSVLTALRAGEPV
ncbi:MAG: ComF family protein [Alphaproteobacteria bacterium]|nr:ComF family protein [Alphaproteobacteria bacterium]